MKITEHEFAIPSQVVYLGTPYGQEAVTRRLAAVRNVGPAAVELVSADVSSQTPITDMAARAALGLAKIYQDTDPGHTSMAA